MKIKSFVVIDDNEAIYLGIRKELERLNNRLKFTYFKNPDSFIEDLEKIEIKSVILLDIFFIHEPSNITEQVYEIVTRRRKDLSIITMSSQIKPYIIQKFFDLGSKGFYLKSDPIEELISAISYINKDIIFLSSSMKNYQFTTNDTSGSNFISNREHQIVQLICNGLSNSEIAEKLFISIFTVQNHRQNIMLKLKVKNTAELIKKAIMEGLVSY